MIRIDELYNNTFWPYIAKNIPQTRLFFCDPPGSSSPENLLNYGQDSLELNYIFLHDQEPIHLDIHKELFIEVQFRNRDIEHWGPCKAIIITSEYQSETVDYVSNYLDWESHYYFFHGWAAMDWYRGYHRSFLISEPESRTITKTFIAPNRIVAGKRQHRVLMLYHIFKNNLLNNWISCPAVCPEENIAVLDVCNSLEHIYPDITEVFSQQTLPMNFPDETGSPMHSCWLSLFDESSECLLYLITETVASGNRLHLTEKSFKPICMRMPFIIVGTRGSLAYLRMYGFKTFGDIWDESYDDEPDDILRIEKIGKLLNQLDSLSQMEKQELFNRAIPIIEHNYNHFYGGRFEAILWDELKNMLEAIRVSLHI